MDDADDTEGNAHPLDMEAIGAAPSRYHLAGRIRQGCDGPETLGDASMRLVSRMMRSRKAGARLLPRATDRARLTPELSFG
jgi:hypothetical protein